MHLADRLKRLNPATTLVNKAGTEGKDGSTVALAACLRCLDGH
ncbi:hypothetical protein [Tabrizicola oligotrophica]|nr:hypothetical protein [Tabrizicola oligotrophica]